MSRGTIKIQGDATDFKRTAKEVESSLTNVESKADATFKTTTQNVQRSTSSLEKMAEVMNVTFALQMLDRIKSISLGILGYATALETVNAQYDALNMVSPELAKNLDIVESASHNLMDSRDVISSIAQASLLGFSISREQLGEVTELATKISQLTGQGVPQAFKQIIDASARMRGTALANMGITIDTERVYREYAFTIGTTSSELSMLDKQTAFLNATIEELNQKTKDIDLGGIEKKARQSTRTLEDGFRDAYEGFATFAIDLGTFIGENMADTTDTVKMLVSESRELDNALDQAERKAKVFVRTMFEFKEVAFPLGGIIKMFDWELTKLSYNKNVINFFKTLKSVAVDTYHSMEASGLNKRILANTLEFTERDALEIERRNEKIMQEAARRREEFRRKQVEKEREEERRWASGMVFNTAEYDKFVFDNKMKLLKENHNLEMLELDSNESLKELKRQEAQDRSQAIRKQNNQTNMADLDKAYKDETDRFLIYAQNKLLKEEELQAGLLRIKQRYDENVIRLEAKKISTEEKLRDGGQQVFVDSMNTLNQAIIQGQDDILQRVAASALQTAGAKIYSEGLTATWAGALKLFNPLTAATGAGEVALGLAAMAAGTALGYVGNKITPNESSSSDSKFKNETTAVDKDSGENIRVYQYPSEAKYLQNLKQQMKNI